MRVGLVQGSGHPLLSWEQLKSMLPIQGPWVPEWVQTQCWSKEGPVVPSQGTPESGQLGSSLLRKLFLGARGSKATARGRRGQSWATRSWLLLVSWHLASAHPRAH